MSTKHLAQLPQLFRSPFLRKIAFGRYHRELAERLEIAGLSDLMKLRLADIFDAVYEVLIKDYRCEYVFKNTLMQNWFLSRHSTERSFITDEFRVGESRVDLALFSKNSVAFEVKTEFDSAIRLASQSAAYMNVFDLVYVVTTESMLPKLDDSIPKTVGILVLGKSGRFKTIRDSESHACRADLSMMFDCLRQPERIAIVEKISKIKINVPNSQIYDECKRVFRKLLPFEANAYVVQQIRNRSYSSASADLMSKVPNSLKHVALTLRATNTEINQIKLELKKIPKTPNTKHQNNHEHIFSVPEGKTERTACA